MKGRLNLFQSAMLRWRDLHPYSAVHVVRVPAPFDRGRLAAVIAAQLERDGLTGLVLDRARRRYEFRGGPAAIEFEVITQNGDGERAISAEIERQLNTPFARDGAIVPFRFFAVPGNGSFRLGLGYDHFIAGGDSIVVLLNKIVDRYAGAPVERPPPDLIRRRSRNCLRATPLCWCAACRGYRASPRVAGAECGRATPTTATATISSCKSSFRPLLPQPFARKHAHGA